MSLLFSCSVARSALSACIGPADTFPVVRHWEPILLAARSELDCWAAAVQESCSEEVVGLPQRCAKVSALFDDLFRILWDTACFRALVARPTVSFFLLSPLLPPACPFHPSQLLEILARRHFVDAHSEPTSVCQSHQEVFSISDRTAPHDSMIWRTLQAGTERPCDGWRDHFSSVVVPSTHDDFSSEFHGSMLELTSDAPFSESELSRTLSKCHDPAPGLDGL